MEMKLKLLLLCSSIFALSSASSSPFEDEKNFYFHGPIQNFPPKETPQYGTPTNCAPSIPVTVNPPIVTIPTPTPVTVNPPIVTTPTPTPITVIPPIVTTPTPTPVTVIPPIVTTPTLPPSSPPFTCNFWKTHPTMVSGLVGWLGSLSRFGIPTMTGFNHDANLIQVLSNTRTDGYGELYREGTASLLNFMVHGKFPYTTSQVRESFVAALGSNQAAEAQARIFKMANEGRIRE